MTREEATKIIRENLPEEYEFPTLRKALLMAISALQPWVRTAERRAEKADASASGWVLGARSTGTVCLVRWSMCSPKAYPWWMPIPPLPEVEE